MLLTLVDGGGHGDTDSVEETNARVCSTVRGGGGQRRRPIAPSFGGVSDSLACSAAAHRYTYTFRYYRVAYRSDAVLFLLFAFARQRSVRPLAFRRLPSGTWCLPHGQANATVRPTTDSTRRRRRQRTQATRLVAVSSSRPWQAIRTAPAVRPSPFSCSLSARVHDVKRQYAVRPHRRVDEKCEILTTNGADNWLTVPLKRTPLPRTLLVSICNVVVPLPFPLPSLMVHYHCCCRRLFFVCY